MSFKVVGIGEVLWDLLPAGRQLGGAPANFAYHARGLGADACVVTRVGSDAAGRDILQRFEAMGLPNGTVQIDPRNPTGSVDVTLDSEGAAHFLIHENVAWDWLALAESALQEVRQANAVCFGSLAQRNPVSRATIQQLVAAAPAESWRIFDINLRQRYYSREIVGDSLRLANVLKCNDSELPVLANLFDLGQSPRQQIEHLAKAFGLGMVVLTRGAGGSLLYQEGRWSEQLSRPVDVIDTVGAGDSFTAALVMGLLHQWDLDEIHSLAAEVARYVCACAGATPVLPDQLRGKFISPKPLFPGERP